MSVSFSESVRDNRLKLVPLEYVVKLIREDKAIREKITLIRSIADSQIRQERKKDLLPIFNPGIFKDNVRKNENLKSIKFLMFDFDHLTEEEYSNVFMKLRSDERTFLMFRSASGGSRLKVLFRLDRELRNQDAYEAIYLYYHNKFSSELCCEIDTGNKNSQLGSFLSYDPELYFNPGSSPLSTYIEFQAVYSNEHIPDNGEYNDLSGLKNVSQFLKRKIKGYTEYVTVLLALASIGEEGRSHFIAICSDNPAYPKDTPERLSGEFDRALVSYNPDRPDRIRINSLFYLAARKGYKIPRRSFEMTEMGLAERISYFYCDRLKYSNELKRWYLWNGKKWNEDRTRAVSDYYKRTLEELKEETRMIKETEKQSDMQKYIRSARSKRTKENVMHLLEEDQKIRIPVDKLDPDRDLFNCENGILELCEGEAGVGHHSPEYLITRSTKARLDPKADCPKWKHFLDTTFKGDMTMIRFIQRAVGYCMTSETSEEVLFFLHGSGANGKTVFIETLGLLFGEYFQKTQIESFLSTDKSAGQANPELMMLKGARLVAGSEIPDNKPLNDKLIKDLTGGDTITARPLYGDYITFRPVCKIILFGNHRPVLKSNDYGIRRRLLMIPFENVIPPEERRDKSEMLAEFETELSGILNWAVEGYRNWYRQRLSPPPQVLAATEGYFTDNDSLQIFINENCVISPQQDMIALDFYKQYSKYLEEKGERVPSAKRVNEKLREKGFEVKPGTANKCYIHGLDIIVEGSDIS